MTRRPSSPAGRPVSVRRAALGVLVVVMGVGLPLEFLPLLPGVLHYASLSQALVIFTELAVVFALAGGVSAAMLSLWCALLNRLRPSAGVAFAGWLTHVLAVLFALHALRTWLLTTGLLAKGHAIAHAGVWLLAVAVFASWIAVARRRRPAGAIPAVAMRGLVLVLPLLAAGALLRLMHPLQVTEPGGHAQPQPAPRPGRHPDVVLVSIDTLSALHMSLHGHAQATTPRLDALATSSTVFDRFYANSNFTTAGVSSLMLGTRPWTHAAVLAPSTPLRHAPDASMLGAFHRAGYRVLSVSTNPWAAPAKLGLMGNVHGHVASRPWRQLCAWDIDAMADGLLSPQTASLLGVAGYWAPLRLRLLRWAVDTGRCPPSGHFDPDHALRAGLRLWDVALREEPGRPVLLWVHLTPPHDPYAPPPPYVGHFDPRGQARRIDDSMPAYHQLSADEAAAQNDRLLGRYHEAIRYVDDRLGAFFDDLRASGRWDTSLVAVTADHGESFGHDYGAHGGPALYEDIVRIPLLLRVPGQTAGRRSGVPAEQADLWPTIAELAGLPAPVGSEGRSMASVWRDGPPPARPVFAMSFERQPHPHALAPGNVVVIDDRWKLHRAIGRDGGGDGAPLLFDVVDDPGELRDQARRHPDVVARLEALIHEELKARRLATSDPP